MTALDRGGVSRLATALVAVSLAAACQRAGLEAVATPEALGKALRDRLGDFRPFRPRLSVDLGWEECVGPPEGDPSCGAELGGEELEALAEVGRRLRPRGVAGGPEAHAGALLRLLAARSDEDLDAVVSELSTLGAEAERDGGVLIDLGAAYLVRALASGSASGLVEAVDAAARAAVDAPDHPAALYNLALAQELMALPRSAAEAVERLQEVEPGSPFAAELRQGPGGDAARGGGPGSSYLAAGAGIRQLVTRSPQRAHEHLLDELLPAWAADVLDGADQRASVTLAAARRLAEALLAVAGEGSGLVIVGEIDRLPAAGRVAAAGAIADFGAGRASFRADDLDAARWRLEAARGAPGLPATLGAWAEVWLALIEIYRGRHDAALEGLDAVESKVQGSAGPALAARIDWHRGLSLLRRGRDAEALTSFRRAQSSFSRAGFAPSEAAMQMMMAEVYHRFGMRAETWRHLLGALRLLESDPEPLWVHNTLVFAAQVALDEALAPAAFVFLEEAKRSAEQAADWVSISEVELFYGRLHASRGEATSARGSIERALEAARSVEARDLRDRIVADARVERAALCVGTQAEAALLELDAVAGFYEMHKLEAMRYRVAVERWRALRGLGRTDDARAEFGGAVDIEAHKHAAISPMPARVSHGERVQALLDEGIEIEIEGGDAARAFALGEIARQFLGLGPAVATSPEAALEEVRSLARRLDEGDVVLTQLLVSGRILIAEARGSGVDFHADAVEGRVLEELVYRYVESLRRGEEDGEAGARLHALLIRPYLRAGDRRLAIVADRFLGAIPYGALRSGDQGERLMERVEVSVAVSTASAIRRLLRKGVPIELAGPGVLLVGDPAFSRQGVRSLPRLPGAAAEVAALEAELGGAKTLTGASATLPAVLREIAGVEVFHFAGHLVAQGRTALGSFLLFAEEGEDPGLVSLERLDAQFEEAAVASPRLVVLSSCRSGTSESLRIPSLGSAARVFLERGAEEVIASLWPVDDRATRELMFDLYRQLAAGRSAGEALRSAQLARLRAADSSDGAWATFVLLTGDGGAPER